MEEEAHAAAAAVVGGHWAGGRSVAHGRVAVAPNAATILVAAESALKGFCVAGSSRDDRPGPPGRRWLHCMRDVLVVRKWFVQVRVASARECLQPVSPAVMCAIISCLSPHRRRPIRARLLTDSTRSLLPPWSSSAPVLPAVSQSNYRRR